MRWSDEQILDLRLADLAPVLHIEGTWLEGRIEQLHRELERCGIVFEPHFWLSDDWFTPEGVTGVALPFFLAHPRLMKIEETQMLEVEGGTPEWCMRILRHETGHAIDNAFRLRRFRRRQQLFGKSTLPYPDSYAPRPYSQSFVLHLENWYAQSHPDEDFAETFAVWMTPRSAWRRTYDGWPALKKLEYVDELMWELAGKTPPVGNRRTIEPLRQLKKTLREHYAQKRARYGSALPNSVAFVAAMIATWKIGATPQPLSAKLPRVELDAIVGLAAPSLVVTEESNFEPLDRWPVDPP
jgi:hypothetical protein